MQELKKTDRMTWEEDHERVENQEDQIDVICLEEATQERGETEDEGTE